MNKNNFVTIALNELHNRHEDLQVEVQHNVSKALSDSEFNKLNKEKRKLIYSIGKVLDQKDEALKLKEQLKKVTDKQNKVLKRLNLTFDDLNEKFNCPKCHDTGYIDGKRCTCLNQLLSEILLKESKINKKNLPKFSDVDYNLYNDAYVKNIKLIFNNVEAYVNTLSSQEKQIVTVSGPTGVGKTFLTECTIGRAIELGYYTLYTTSIGLNANMLKYHVAPIEEKYDIIAPYLNCDLLVIDDLGTEPIFNNVTKEYLYLIISERLKEGLYTFINTNLQPSQIINIYGERIFSRIANINNCILIDMTANDIRLGLRK